MLLPHTPVQITDGQWEYKALGLDEGKNLFMIKAIESHNRFSYNCDFLLVYYATQFYEDDVRAVILIDSRLHAQPDVADKLSTYASMAEAVYDVKSDIKIIPVEGIDDWSTDQVKNHVHQLVNQHFFLEGVLFVGNIKLPSFFKPRADIIMSRLITHKYEDLDLILQKRDPLSNADYDYMEKGANPLPDMWCSFLPVGSSSSLPGDYAFFATQINTYLDKIIEIYRSGKTYQKLYKVSNQLWNLSPIAQEWGLSAIDFYAVNDTGNGPFHWYTGIPPAAFYKRAPIDSFNNYNDFNNYFRRWPWMGENWQTSEIYLNHLNNSEYNIIWTNVHSSEGFSVISTEQAKSIIGGGLIQFASGCNVGGFRQPGSSSHVDTLTYVDQNILCGYLYGQSDFIAALGCTFWRGHEPEYNRLGTFLAQGDALGLAHYFRKCVQYMDSPDPDNLKIKTQEILLGDPFLTTEPGIDLQPLDIIMQGSSKVGETLHFYPVLKSLGRLNSGSFICKWMLNDSRLLGETTHSMTANITITDEVNAMTWLPLYPGRYKITLIIDSQSQIEERNEYNNMRTLNLDITGGPTAVICGDVNNDYMVDIIDAFVIAQYYVGLDPTPFNTEHADVDGNGSIDILDAFIVAQFFVGLIPSLNC